MNGKTPKDIPEENIERLIASSAGEPETEFQRRLTEAVLDELHERPAPSRKLRSRVLRWGAALVASAAVIAALVLWNLPSNTAQRPDSDSEKPGLPVVADARPGGQLRTVYGLVSIQNGQSPQQVDETADVKVGQWIETHWGSEAAILLPDESQLAVRPRSRVQIADKPNGARLVIRKGRVRLDVAKQSPGNSLTVETPGAEITVLGTRLDIHVVQKSDGRKQTRVSVLSGKVELESAGRKVVLLPNMEGVADEGEAPRTRSLSAEVNEIIRLIVQTETLAADSAARAGRPSIVEFNGDGSATLWTVVAVPNTTQDDLTSYRLPQAPLEAAVEAYTLDGAELPVMSEQGGWQVDLSIAHVPPGGESAVIVRVPDIEGVFQNQGTGTHEFDSPASESDELALVQFRLPASARIQELNPAPIETRRTLSRLLLTVAVRGRFSDTLFQQAP